MEKLKSIKDFKKEELNLTEQIYGGRNDVSLTHRDTQSMDEWNCGDTVRTMYWDGTPCSEPFVIWQEQ